MNWQWSYSISPQWPNLTFTSIFCCCKTLWNVKYNKSLNPRIRVTLIMSQKYNNKNISWSYWQHASLTLLTDTPADQREVKLTGSFSFTNKRLSDQTTLTLPVRTIDSLWAVRPSEPVSKVHLYTTNLAWLIGFLDQSDNGQRKLSKSFRTF